MTVKNILERGKVTDMIYEITISEQTRDKLYARGNRDETPEQIILRLLKLTEPNPLENIPEEFDDYGQLERYINCVGFIEYRKTGPNVDMVKTRIISSDKLSSLDIYYKLQDGKFVRCRGEDSLENVESLEKNT